MAPAQTYFYYASTPHVDIIQLHSSLWQDSRILIWLVLVFTDLAYKVFLPACQVED